MNKRDMLLALITKVNWEGGWEDMVLYGDPPHITEFPELHEEFMKLKESIIKLDDIQTELENEYNIDPEETEV